MPLSRRQFLVGAAGAGAAGILAARHPWASSAPGSPTPAAAARGADGDGILVLLTLYGGNDGLNTVIPYEDGHYLGGRAQLGYTPEEVIPLAEGLALHPALKGFKALWDQGRLAVVRGVGYPDPSRSHFRSMDIWQSAAAESAVPSGWLGRWLDGAGTDPLRAVSVGPSLPRALTGERAAAAAVPVGPLALELPGGRMGTAFAALSGPTPGAAPLAARVARSGADLLTVDHTLADLLVSAGGSPPTSAATPRRGAGVAGGKAAGGLASQLDLVGRLVRAGGPSRAYSVSLGGFDTHANEKEAHARLWAEVDAAVAGFLTGLADDPSGRRVVLVAYSEFGRRVAANASGGTDHGTAAPVFVAGPTVQGGFYGDEPGLADLDAGDLRFTTDFRSVYATVLGAVLGVDPSSVLGRRYPTLAFL